MFCISNKTGLLVLFLPILAGCARHYHGQGIVLAVRGPEVTISHRAIPGYMPAMAMPFPVAHASDLDQLTPGSRVRFDLRVRNGRARITKVRQEAAPAPDFPLPKLEHVIAIGQRVPDFTLTDERGRPAHLSDSLGRLTAIEFIYTRCPLPDVCPRLSANFALLQKRFGPRIALLSITLDPEYDTPEVLASYGKRWRADPAVWRFLTGTPEAIRRVAGNFGLVYWAEDGAITHSSSTALISPTGILVARIQGSSYTPKQLSDLVAHNAGALSSSEGPNP